MLKEFKIHYPHNTLAYIAADDILIGYETVPKRIIS